MAHLLAREPEPAFPPSLLSSAEHLAMGMGRQQLMAQAPEPQGEPGVFLIPCRSGAKLGAKNDLGSSVNLGSCLEPRGEKNP